MERRDKILNCIDLKAGPGLEIGALCYPIVTSDEADIRYVDWADTPALRARYADDAHVDIEKIVHVDYVWSEKPLEKVTEEQKFKYAILSHVGEHFPDLIGRLQQITEVIEDGGIISLVLPDRRFTFDRLRRESTISEILEAFLAKRQKPTFSQLFDQIAHSVDLDPAEAWSMDLNEVELNTRRHWPIDKAYNHCLGLAAMNQYHDVHCWVFTSHSFLNVMRDIIKIGLLPYELVSFHAVSENTNEFFVSFRKVSNRPLSLDQLDNLVQDSKLHNGPQNRADNDKIQENSAVNQKEIQLLQRIDQLQKDADFINSEKINLKKQIEQLNHDLEAIRASKSWRATAPLRKIMQGMYKR